MDRYMDVYENEAGCLIKHSACCVLWIVCVTECVHNPSIPGLSA